MNVRCYNIRDAHQIEREILLTLSLFTLLSHSTFQKTGIISVLGGFGAICFIAWLYFVYDTPGQHPRISSDELAFIVEHLQSKQSTSKRNARVPWTRILLSMSVWGTAIAKFAGSWGYYMLLTKLPAYLSEVLDFSIDAVS